jgi:glycosyltransferase involved in cell wall biosynthesis
MKILLATYNYYPYNWGGSEVYIAGLARYLQQQENELCIIAATPCEEHPLFYEDENLEAISYVYNQVPVVGVNLRNTNTKEIYSKSNPSWTKSYENLLQKIAGDKWDVFHMHAFTPAIGLSLLHAVRLTSPKVKVIFSYHVPISCSKATLLFGNELKACTVTPTTSICTACMISERGNMPIKLTRFLTMALPVVHYEKLPTIIKLKYLVSEHIKAFKELAAIVNEWQVFSEQIKKILNLNNIASFRIKLLKHGVNTVFLTTGETHLKTETYPTVFVYAGRFEKFKGFYTLLNAWCSLAETSDRELWLIGNFQTITEDENVLLSAAKRRKDILWKGKLEQKEMADLLLEAHCIIVPSECVEIGPLVFHEGVAAGCDVIASDIGGCRELAKSYAAKSTLFETGNSKQLAEAIIHFKYSGLEANCISQIENYEQVYRSYRALCAE